MMTEETMNFVVRFAIVVSCIVIGRIIRMANWKKRKRLLKDIPADMHVLYEDSGRFYFLCAMPAVTAILILGIIVLAKYDIGDSWSEILQDAGVYFLLLVLLLVGFQLLSISVLKAKNRHRILWNQDQIWVDSFSRPRKQLRYEDIRKIVHRTKSGLKASGITAYDSDGEKLFFVAETMTTYPQFCEMLYQKRRNVITTDLS